MVTFVDPGCPRPYTGACVGDGGLGGTEAVVIRVAERLARTRRVRVLQRGRTDRVTRGGVGFAPLADAGVPHPGPVVVVNAWKVALKLRRAAPGVEVRLWMHVHPGRHNRVMGPALAAAGIGVVCVSASHAAALGRFLGGGRAPAIGHIHNPIEDEIAPPAGPRDLDLLLFASAPHKGLDETLAQFAALRRRVPGLRLEVADPGYLAWRIGPLPEGVRLLGHVRRPELLARMGRSLCLFYPQTRFAETFGLVIAEANALGVPALLHRGLGANDEVASTAEQCVDALDPDAIAARIEAWRLRPPSIVGQPRFRLAAVAARWEAELGAPAGIAPNGIAPAGIEPVRISSVALSARLPGAPASVPIPDLATKRPAHDHLGAGSLARRESNAERRAPLAASPRESGGRRDAPVATAVRSSRGPFRRRYGPPVAAPARRWSASDSPRRQW